VRDTQLSFYLKTAIFYTLLFIASSAIGQNNNFKPNQIIEIGGGQKLKILKCKGEGVAKECEVIQLMNNKQVGNSFWLVASKILQQIKPAPAKTLKALPRKRIEERIITVAKKGNVKVSETRTLVGAPLSQEVKTFVPGTDTEKKIVRHKYYVEQQPKEGSTAATNSFKQKDTATSKTFINPVSDTTPAVSIVKDRDTAANKTDTSTKEGTRLKIGDVHEAKETIVKDASVTQAKKLGIFIDCSAGCDMNYLKAELPIVDFLLDMNAADVHVLINQQPTGGGGKSIQMIFYGQHTFITIRDTITVSIMPGSTDLELRAGLLKGIKRGLVPFILKTPFAEFIDWKINTASQKNDGVIDVTKDSWNYWVFTIGATGTFSTDQVYKSTQVSSYISGERTTDKLKVSFSASGNYNDYKYNYNDRYSSVQYHILNRSYLFQHLLIKSLGKHFGMGYEIAYSKNTFYNNKSRAYGRVGIEYSIFPYNDVNTRFFTIDYSIDARANRYYDTTIYFLTKELLFGHAIHTNISFNQRWGTISGTIAYSNFFKDAALNNLSASFSVYVRITGGLSFNSYIFGSRVQDQIYLAKGSATLQDILARGRQLASKYNLSSGFGLTFRFGSKLNNFVNPRMLAF
jgi:hypothetical protein